MATKFHVPPAGFVDAGDNDPARFCRYVAVALEGVRPGVCAPVAALLRGPQSPPLEAVVVAVINQFVGAPGEGEVTLILDDDHLIEAAAVDDSVRLLLERLPPGLRLVLASRAAAAWHEQHEFADDAVRHAVAAGEAAWAARLVERHVEALLRRSEGATLNRWLATLPTETIRSRARLCLAQAISAIVAGRLELVEPLVADAERAFATTGDEPHEPSVGRALSVLANVPASCGSSSTPRPWVRCRSQARWQPLASTTGIGSQRPTDRTC